MLIITRVAKLKPAGLARGMDLGPAGQSGSRMKCLPGCVGLPAHVVTLLDAGWQGLGGAQA